MHERAPYATRLRMRIRCQFSWLRVYVKLSTPQCYWNFGQSQWDFDPDFGQTFREFCLWIKWKQRIGQLKHFFIMRIFSAKSRKHVEESGNSNRNADGRNPCFLWGNRNTVSQRLLAGWLRISRSLSGDVNLDRCTLGFAKIRLSVSGNREKKRRGIMI